MRGGRRPPRTTLANARARAALMCRSPRSSVPTVSHNCQPMSEIAKDGWYRSADWDEASRTEFAARLKRARPYNQIQYRRIKALALLGTTDPVRQEAGRAMLEENLAILDLSEFERTVALTTLARQERSHGRLAGALRALRQALAMGGPEASGTTGEEEIELAEVLLERGGAADIPEAKTLLDRRASDPPIFVRSRYRLAVGQARACLAVATHLPQPLGHRRHSNSRTPRHSGLRNHPKLGLVDPPEAERAWLRDVASAGKPPSDIPAH